MCLYAPLQMGNTVTPVIHMFKLYESETEEFSCEKSKPRLPKKKYPSKHQNTVLVKMQATARIATQSRLERLYP